MKDMGYLNAYGGTRVTFSYRKIGPLSFFQKTKVAIALLIIDLKKIMKSLGLYAFLFVHAYFIIPLPLEKVYILNIMEHIMGILQAVWQIFLDAGIFIIFGFFIAAVIRSFISTETIVRYLGGSNIRSVFLAALFGVPLPLCSCGVVPTAIGIRKQGASKPATVSFLITTPESSIDSIAITYALIDPLMTVFRPIAAFITGFIAGVGEIMFGKKEDTKKIEDIDCPHCHGEGSMRQEAGGTKDVKHRHTFGEKISMGFRFAFVELLRDISRWFLVGMLIAGIISYAIPPSFIENYLGQGWRSMFIMLAIGLPLYVCATASTPIAAALILKGMSPGAALVFLLAGPATNAASLVVIAKMLGKRTAVIYILSISACAVLLGMLLNWLYNHLGIDITASAGHAHEMIPVWLKWATALPLTIAMLFAAGKGKH